jgi:ElaA protein
MHWQYYKKFSDFTPQHLYAVLKLRQDVFIIEQNCIYPDIDGLDEMSSHLLGFYEDQLIAYSRIVPAGYKFDEISVGRIVVNSRFRSHGYGKKLIEESLDIVRKLGEEKVRIEAQAHLQNYYENLGFRKTGTPYDVDGIPHIQMLIEL